MPGPGLPLLLVMAMAGFVSAVIPVRATESCQSCHEDASIEASVHAGFECEDCHVGREELPHPESLLPVDCSSCHLEAQDEFSRSLHAGIRINGSEFRCSTCHGTHDIQPAQGENSQVLREHVADFCGTCHGNLKFVTEQGGLFSTRPYYAYQESVHGLLVESGDTGAAVCTDCHEAHGITRPNDPRSPIFRSRIPETCGGCHDAVYEEYRDSIHGKAAAAGITASPVCTDCHGIHSIRSPVDPDSSVSARAIARSTCARCHEGERISTEFGVPRQRVESYYDSYHGLAGALGSIRTANCASCHGVHDIRQSIDPRSSIHPDNLPETCGHCHPGATENFARGQIHLVSAAVASPDGETNGTKDPLGTRVVQAVRELYIVLIVVVIGGMLLHNLLDFAVRVRRRLANLDAPHLRLTVGERFQHALLALSFMTLVVTGFALKFPETAWVRALFLGSPELRANLHRVAAVAMMTLAVWHLCWLVLLPRGREQRRALRPGIEDLREMFATVGRNLGFQIPQPLTERFGYVEKAEYWALVWGTIIMAVTGLMLWAEETALKVMPKWGLDVAEVIHYYEAWLATLAIIVWHLYFTLLRPGNRTQRWAWLTGRLSVDEWREEHPGEYERSMESSTESQGETKKGVGR